MSSPIDILNIYFVFVHTRFFNLTRFVWSLISSDTMIRLILVHIHWPFTIVHDFFLSNYSSKYSCVILFLVITLVLHVENLTNCSMCCMSREISSRGGVVQLAGEWRLQRSSCWRGHRMSTIVVAERHASTPASTYMMTHGCCCCCCCMSSSSWFFQCLNLDDDPIVVLVLDMHHVILSCFVTCFDIMCYVWRFDDHMWYVWSFDDGFYMPQLYIWICGLTKILNCRDDTKTTKKTMNQLCWWFCCQRRCWQPPRLPIVLTVLSSA